MAVTVREVFFWFPFFAADAFFTATVFFATRLLFRARGVLALTVRFVVAAALRVARVTGFFFEVNFFGCFLVAIIGTGMYCVKDSRVLISMSREESANYSVQSEKLKTTQKYRSLTETA